MGIKKEVVQLLRRAPARLTSTKQVPVKMRATKSPRDVDSWRHDNVGRLMNSAIRRFEARVLEIMKDAGYRDTRISHVNLTRNLDRPGTRVTELAKRSAMTKQAMGELVDQCVLMGLVERVPDPADGRARTVRFTKAGLEWLDAFRKAVDQAELEMGDEIGQPRLESIRVGLAKYAVRHDSLRQAD
ncbi:MarR family winged helix-turn-helix transcriptional regulator [Tardiphaga sp. 709]|uniref:MarR family winged helix-turn-helix transcriptional regulator n=1 Tax=Tardiphaga sp. 709 TaxID=3076039 RepID=UPI0028E6DD13|nr:MarR family winged helix-turn-helix transcriptional regulator [Tardiphaga sp. 709]WNV11733.1 MarR family winged helix-turn-helix transcriptional regulator [Tardiphaga sp. 709]